MFEAGSTKFGKPIVIEPVPNTQCWRIVIKNGSRLPPELEGMWKPRALAQAAVDRYMERVKCRV